MTMDVLKAALMYAGRGWPVFPCRPDKTPLTKHGVMDATTSEKKIREWFTTNPFANVAIDVGESQDTEGRGAPVLQAG